MKVAIIGSGISGLTTAYLLNKKHDITLFEKDSRLGGHTATMDFSINGQDYSVDTGFIVFNDRTYPNFIKLLGLLGVDYNATSMGFSVSCPQTGLEYAGNNLNTLFAQRKRLFDLSFWRMLKDIMRFNKQAQQDYANGSIVSDMTLGEYLKQNNYSDGFAHYYLVPMGAAIWSASFAAMKQFPVAFFVKFFFNHGLLDVVNRPQWRVVSGGSKAYIAPLTESFKEKIVLGAQIKRVKRLVNGVNIEFSDERVEHFDQVVFATHSDQALALLDDVSDVEQAILGDIPYQSNSVVLHFDEKMLPKNKRTWSSWNYLLKESINTEGDSEQLPVLTYNMNILQGIQSDKTFCVTLNAEQDIAKEKIIGKYHYAHPQFSRKAIQAQQRWDEINGVNNTWFCGAYWANGFHEDGVVSAMRVAERFGVFL